jgi:hypothetical protein
MNVIPQIPLTPLATTSPLIFGRRLNSDPDSPIENPIDPMKTEPTVKLTITPTEPMKTEPTAKLTITPTEPMKTEPTVKLTITPTEPMKTEPTVKLTITPTEPMKTELRLPAMTIIGQQPLVFARKTCL